MSGKAASSLDVTDLARAHPRSHPELRAAHPAVDAGDQDAARGRRARSSQRDRRRDSRPALGAAGAARVPGSHRFRSRNRKGADHGSHLAAAGGVMDPRLLQYYNLELQHLRETGAEFAEQFPKIAARLGMHGLDVADPYVERLLEGVGVSGGARAAQARRRVPALHAGAARDRLSPLPGADAVDAGRSAHARSERSQSGRRPQRAARQHAVGLHRPPTMPRRVSFAPRRTSRCGRSRSCRRAISRSRPICRSTRCRSRSASRAACGFG